MAKDKSKLIINYQNQRFEIKIMKCEVETYKCKYCDYTITTNQFADSNLLKHLVVAHHNFKYRRKLYKSLTNYIMMYSNFIKDKTFEEVWVCPVCNKKFIFSKPSNPRFYPCANRRNSVIQHLNFCLKHKEQENNEI